MFEVVGNKNFNLKLFFKTYIELQNFKFTYSMQIKESSENL